MEWSVALVLGFATACATAAWCFRDWLDHRDQQRTDAIGFLHFPDPDDEARHADARRRRRA